jgi:hypothetical protein
VLSTASEAGKDRGRDGIFEVSARPLAGLETDGPDPPIPIHVEDEAGVPRRIDELAN